ncbi:MAG: hypothetical protein A2Y38_02330 [Spirochaetes bacterium GWB1_59_5]|nr:MAG: hypothetical protein A2Y38_02330 [Spirochaetes bacterium GWB1_59_5]
MESIWTKIVAHSATATLIAALSLSISSIFMLRASIDGQVLALETTLRNDFDLLIKCGIETAVANASPELRSRAERLQGLVSFFRLSGSQDCDIAANLI